METVQTLIERIETHCDFFEVDDGTLSCWGSICDPEDISIISLLEQTLTLRFGGEWSISQDWERRHEVAGHNLKTVWDSRLKQDLNLEEHLAVEVKRETEAKMREFDRKAKALLERLDEMKTLSSEMGQLMKDMEEQK